MRVLIDIGHPAHVHFFSHVVRELRADGHDLLVTSRTKECAAELLDAEGLEHIVLSHARGGTLALARELVMRDIALARVARRFRPDVMTGVGGTFVAHVGALLSIPSLVFYDTENARLQNLITYPFASLVAVPRCYGAWVPRRHLRYDGYHELAYLHPARFRPDRERARAAGLADGETFVVRVVSWQANHDIGERGWGRALLNAVVERLAARGTVIVSAEGELPPSIEPYRFAGPAAAMHDVLAHARLFVGESATMASEAAVLGVPAIYAAHTGRGYTDEQELRYGLVANVRTLDERALLDAIERMLAKSQAECAEARARLLSDTVDVTALATGLLTGAPASLRAAGRG